MATTEHTINDALAEILRELRTAWRANNVVSSENTGTIQSSTGRPDILICEPGVSPVIIETEVFPASTVEADARSRLGVSLSASGGVVHSVIAVRVDSGLRNVAGKNLASAIKENRNYEYCLLTYDSTNVSRWPMQGWLRGGVDDIALLAQSAAVPPKIIDAAAEKLIRGVSSTAALLNEISKSHSESTSAIASELKQEDGEQTRRMASAILANAFVFQDSLAFGNGGLKDVKDIQRMRAETGITRSAVLSEWRKILKVNYWPIFDVAKRILEQLPASSSAAVLECLAETAEALVESNLMRSHDLTGAVFQRLIADRKYLAAYYTTPASAALLAGLVIKREANPAGRPWSDRQSLESIKVGDFACGTGTLLSTAYQRISLLYELAQGDASALHPKMMANGLVGCDVLPAAAHLTASMLAGAHPRITFRSSSIITMGYGIQPDGGVSLGSLDLLNPQARISTVAQPGKLMGGKGEEVVSLWAAVANDSFDVVLMNPPFTRPTGHEGEKIGVRNPMFAAFNASKKEQGVMAREAAKLTKDTAYHGNAGEASAFAVLADRKLRKGGTVGLVLPLSFVVGDAWRAVRSLLATDYGEIIIVSIAGSKDLEMSFSADTNMGECLVVARKGVGPSTQATFVILRERPNYPMIGSAIASAVNEQLALGNIRSLEEGPVGGTPLRIGSDEVGAMMVARIPREDSWDLVRISDLSLAQTSWLLSRGTLWLPGMPSSGAKTVPICRLDLIATIGPYHMDINADGAKGAIRGPFDVVSVTDSSVCTYPILWAQDAATQNKMAFECDSEGLLKSGRNDSEEEQIRDKAQYLLDNASHCHFNRDFRFNSQSLSMQFTQRKAIGGRAWLSINARTAQREKALVVWSNSILGVLLHWWSANKQQSGRGSIGKTSLGLLPVLNLDDLTDNQLIAAEALFDSLADRQLLPLHNLSKDLVRKELDRGLLVDVLGLDSALLDEFGSISILRAKLENEPSIRGGK